MINIRQILKILYLNIKSHNKISHYKIHKIKFYKIRYHKIFKIVMMIKNSNI